MSGRVMSPEETAEERKRGDEVMEARLLELETDLEGARAEAMAYEAELEARVLELETDLAKAHAAHAIDIADSIVRLGHAKREMCAKVFEMASREGADVLITPAAGRRPVVCRSASDVAAVWGWAGLYEAPECDLVAKMSAELAAAEVRDRAARLRDPEAYDRDLRGLAGLISPTERSDRE